MANVNLNFVSKKISKIRWRPVENDGLALSDVFATGTWDDQENEITLWRINLDDATIDTDQANPEEPHRLCDVRHTGDIMGLEFVNSELLLSSSSSGSLSLYKHHSHSHTLTTSHQWSGIHSYSGDRCACTCVAARGDELVATGGEDGKINIIHIEQQSPLRVIDKADSCTINSVVFLRQSELITVNATGQVKLFDIRENNDEPTKTYSVSGEDRVPLHCVARHPSQQHIVATGAEDGMLYIWDLRQEKFPVNPLEAHSAALWEVLFHPTHPDNLFTCSEDGTVWHWDSSGADTNTMSFQGLGGSMHPHSIEDQSSSWLTISAAHNKLKVVELFHTDGLAVNSLDIMNNMVICGTDSEVVCTISNLVIK